MERWAGLDSDEFFRDRILVGEVAGVFSWGVVAGSSCSLFMPLISDTMISLRLSSSPFSSSSHSPSSRSSTSASRSATARQLGQRNDGQVLGSFRIGRMHL